MNRNLETEADEIETDFHRPRGIVRNILRYLARNHNRQDAGREGTNSDKPPLSHVGQVTFRTAKSQVPADPLRGIPFTGYTKDDTEFLGRIYDDHPYGDSGVA